MPLNTKAVYHHCNAEIKYHANNMMGVADKFSQSFDLQTTYDDRGRVSGFTPMVFTDWLHQGDIELSESSLDLVTPQGYFMPFCKNGDEKDVYYEKDVKLAMKVLDNGQTYLVNKARPRDFLLVQNGTNKDSLPSSDMVKGGGDLLKNGTAMTTELGMNGTLINKQKAVMNFFREIDISKKLITKSYVQNGDTINLKTPDRTDQDNGGIGPIVFGGVSRSQDFKKTMNVKGNADQFLSLAGRELLNISVQGKDGKNTTISLTCKVSNNNAFNAGEFNSLDTLKKALNEEGAGLVNAEVVGTTLYIGAVDANAEIKFTGDLAARFGFTDVEASRSVNGKMENRYNTTEGLLDVLKKIPGIDIKINQNNKKAKIRYGNLNERVEILSQAKGQVTTNGVYITSYGDTATGNQGRKGEVTIVSPNDLKVGDIIDLERGTTVILNGITLADGKYVVAACDANSFKICSQAVVLNDLSTSIAGANWDAAAGPNNNGGIGLQTGKMFNILDDASKAQGIKWSKSLGSSNSGVKTVTCSQDLNPVIIAAELTAQGLAIGDIVYVQGGAVGGGDFDQSGYYTLIADGGGGNANFGDDVRVRGGAGATSIKVIKVGTTAAGNAITAGAVGARQLTAKAAMSITQDSKTAKIFVGNAKSTYRIGDYVSLENLDPNGFQYNTIAVPAGRIKSTDLLKVTSVEEGYIEIELPLEANQNISFNTNDLGVGVYLNKAPHMFEGLGLERNKMKWNPVYSTDGKLDTVCLTELAKLDAENYLLSELPRFRDIKNSLQISEHVEVVNSDDKTAKVKVVFATLDKSLGKVAYEIFVEEEDGMFPVETLNKFGMIHSGVLSFNTTSGKLEDTNVDPFYIKFNSNNNTVKVDLNLGNMDFSAADRMEKTNLKANGHRAGEIKTIEMVDNQLRVTYSNGITIAKANLVFAAFDNVNALKYDGDNLLRSGPETGNTRYLNAGHESVERVRAFSKLSAANAQQSFDALSESTRRQTYANMAKFKIEGTEEESRKIMQQHV